MAVSPSIIVFIEKGLAAGIPQESLVSALASQGWPQKEIYEAFSGHYRRLIGIDVPRRPGATASARDAFFYLLIFSTLATWTIGFAYLASDLIDRWLADPLFAAFRGVTNTSSLAEPLASLLVAFPLYLLVSRSVLRDVAADPEKLDSPIRKWLTYMALVIAAGVFMGDLITALTFLLRGEWTSRFLAKSFVILMLSSGVFFYYFGGLRKTSTTPTPLSRDSFMALTSSAAFVLIVVLGLLQLGRPSVQRQLRADNQRIRDLSSLSLAMNSYWQSHGSQLPSGLDLLSGSPSLDPLTGAPYRYIAGQGSHYQLCADFALTSDPHDAAAVVRPWTHPAGHHCFPLDASIFPQPMIPNYNG